jgi:hypothetical protein
VTTPADPTVSLVTIAEVHSHLNIPDADTSHDDELMTRFAIPATEVAQQSNVAGPITQRPVTEQHDGGRAQIVLYQPCVTVGSVVEYWGAVAYPLTEQPLGGTVSNFYGYTIDGQVLTRRLNGWSGYRDVGMFPPGRSNVIVTYTAGAPFVSEMVKHGILELVRFWYQTGQQGGSGGTQMAGRGGYGANSPSGPGPRYVPDFVKVFFTPDSRPSGIA